MTRFLPQALGRDAVSSLPTKLRMRRAIFCALSGLLLAVAGCGSDDGDGPSSATGGASGGSGATAGVGNSSGAGGTGGSGNAAGTGGVAGAGGNAASGGAAGSSGGVPGSPKSLAFPGAVRAGARTKGALAAWYANPTAANWPELYEVTNTNTSGAGSLPDALSKPGRLIVFRTGGKLVLTSQLTVKSDNLTIAMNTAPADSKGFAVTNSPWVFKASNTILRGGRVRMFKPSISGADALAFIGTSAGNTDAIIANMSVAGSQDGCFDISREGSSTVGFKNITVQDSFVTYAGAAHDLNMLVKYAADVTLFQNFFGLADGRNPRVGLESQRVAIVNNISYDWKSKGGEIGGQTSSAWMFNSFNEGSGNPARAMDAQGVGATWTAYIEGNISAQRPSQSVDDVHVFRDDRILASASQLPKAGSDAGAVYVVGPKANGNYDVHLDTGSSYQVKVDAVLVGGANKPSWVPEVNHLTDVSAAVTEVLKNSGCRVGGTDLVDKAAIDHYNANTSDRWDGESSFAPLANENYSSGTKPAVTGPNQIVPNAWLSANGFKDRIGQDNRGYVISTSKSIGGWDWSGWTLVEAWIHSVNL